MQQARFRHKTANTTGRNVSLLRLEIRQTLHHSTAPVSEAGFASWPFLSHAVLVAMSSSLLAS